MGIRIAVLFFCPKALISRDFGLLRCLLLPSRTIAHRQSSPQRRRMVVGYRLFLGLPFNLWVIVSLLKLRGHQNSRIYISTVMCYNVRKSRQEGITMGVSVAEYYGQRTDVDYPIIQPVVRQMPCPFTCGNICKKLKSGNPPVCSVRKPDGTLWIVCSERLCATKKDIPLCEHQCAILHDILE